MINNLSGNINELAKMWLEEKEAEREAIENRRIIEDQIKIIAEINDALSGTELVSASEFVVKIVGRIDYKVDSDMLQDLAFEHGISYHLPSLFRWKTEINMSAWKAADAEITKPLSGAITAKPGRPSFAITRKEK